MSIKADGSEMLGLKRDPNVENPAPKKRRLRDLIRGVLKALWARADTPCPNCRKYLETISKLSQGATALNQQQIRLEKSLEETQGKLRAARVIAKHEKTRADALQHRLEQGGGTVLRDLGVGEVERIAIGGKRNIGNPDGNECHELADSSLEAAHKGMNAYGVPRHRSKAPMAPTGDECAVRVLGNRALDLRLKDPDSDDNGELLIREGSPLRKESEGSDGSDD